MTRFCYMTRYALITDYVHDRDFETPWLLYVNREQLHFRFRCIYFDYILLILLISSSVANNSVCVRSNIVWNRWKSTLKPRSKE